VPRPRDRHLGTLSPRLIVFVLAMDPAMALQMLYGRAPSLAAAPATDG
jgi:hypothetical protein